MTPTKGVLTGAALANSCEVGGLGSSTAPESFILLPLHRNMTQLWTSPQPEGLAVDRLIIPFMVTQLLAPLCH